MVNDVVHFEGGGIRQSALGKGTFKYIPTVALRRLSHRYQYGEIKYGATDNFKKGLPISDCWDSAMRHMVAYLEGDNSEDHMAAVIWNACCIMEMECNNRNFVDIDSRKNIPARKCSPEYYRDLALKCLQKGENLK